MEAAFTLVLLCISFLSSAYYRYFDWNMETIGSSNKTSTICNHEKNYIPFYYIFGEVIEIIAVHSRQQMSLWRLVSIQRKVFPKQQPFLSILLYPLRSIMRQSHISGWMKLRRF